MDDKFGLLEIIPALAEQRVISITKILKENLKIEKKEGFGTSTRKGFNQIWHRWSNSQKSSKWMVKVSK